MKKIFLISLLLIIPFIAYGAEGSRDLLPGISSSTGVAGLVAGLINIMISVGVLLAVIMLSVGGFQYMTQDAGSSKEAAKKTITQAVLGVLILLAAWLLLFIINPQILDIKFLGTGTGRTQQIDTSPVSFNDAFGITSSPRASVDDLETHTITNDIPSSGNFWEDKYCDKDKTRQVSKDNPEAKTGITNISEPGDCKRASFWTEIRESFSKSREELGKETKCSFTITCVRK